MRRRVRRHVSVPSEDEEASKGLTLCSTSIKRAWDKLSLSLADRCRRPQSISLRTFNSAHLHDNESQIVVLLRVADPVSHLGGNPRADLVGWEVSGLAEQQLQAFLAELFVLGVVRLWDAVG